ncbi:hypothetical protein [Lapillicoccus jejuensis]|uniref:Nucleotidyltransferase-like protein n=1 Tax=Lapillicoccus jejuensis TaxID=402171 RepID=A0A542DZE6_9MICO|nr:hypothetical protein [Lapillicoccus jejuensis]TQJ08426.1 hypothetical protein FB458_1514 [Lapillicoccus jejuensis]
MHPTLLRLDRLAEHLAHDDGVVAVLGVGSAGTETERFDDHSDIDFFVVTADEAAQDRLIAGVGWLEGFGGEVVWSYVNSRHGRKALLPDGLFLEYAVFTADELPTMSYAGARVVWRRDGYPAPEQARNIPTAADTVAFHVDEALGNLIVGLHRDLRGERLTAMRFVQVFAVDHVLAVARLQPDPDEPGWVLPDPFEGTRRLEESRPALARSVARMTQGYGRTLESAAAVLDWLVAHGDPDPAAVNAVRGLLA